MMEPTRLRPTTAPPWDMNPSEWTTRVPICVLAAIAFFIASYLALYQWRLVDRAWDPVFGRQTEAVLDSDVSMEMKRWMRVPDAALGAFAYLGDAILGIAGSTRRWQHRPWLVILFGLDVIPLSIVSAILMFTQGFVVGAWCFLCLVTGVISLVMVALAYKEVWSTLYFLYRVWRITRSPHLFWKTLWGRPSREAALIACGADSV